MSISQYHAFLKTIELGSLTKAADALGYTQSGITHLLNSLEDECNLKLLIRDRAGVKITSDGKQLLPYIQSICNEKINLSAKINEIHRLESGLIRIGTFTSVSAQWLPGIIKTFKTSFPKIRFELHHGTNDENEAWILNGKIDCAFVRIPAHNKLESVLLKRDPIIAILSTEHPLSSKTHFPINELDRWPYIRPYEGVDDEISEIFQIHDKTPNVEFSEKDDYAIIAMVEKNLGFSILPQLVVQNSSRSIVQQQLEIPAYRDIGIAYKNKLLLSASAKTFISYVQDWINNYYSEKINTLHEIIG